MTDSEQEMLDRISDRMSELMSRDPDWRDEASEIVGMLDRSDIFVLPEGKTPSAWCRSLFETPGLSVLAEAAIKMDLAVEQAARPIDLLVLLLPSDHHLD
jgi:hypothetical protein